MKRTIGTLTIILGLAVGGPALAYPTDQQLNNEQNNNQSAQMEHIKFSQLPQPVQNTINRHLEGGNARQIDQLTQSNGQTCYRVKFTDAKGNSEHFFVGSNGKYLGEKMNKENGMQNNNTTSQDQNSGGLRPRQDER